MIFSEFRNLVGPKSTRERNIMYVSSYLLIINYIQIILWNDVTNQFIDVNPDDISNFYFLQTILSCTCGCTREQIFPTPNIFLPLFIKTIEIDSREQVERLENIRY